MVAPPPEPLVILAITDRYEIGELEVHDPS